MNGRAAQEHGFTLLEMLVALALAGLLAMTLTDSLRTAIRSWEAGARRVARTEALVRLDHTLRNRLMTLVSAGGLGAIAGNPPLFFGAPDGFGWVAHTPDEAGGPGLFGQRVRLDANGGLILENWPLDQPAHTIAAPLDTDGATVEFGYFGTLPPDPTPRWTTRWPAGPIPPRLVRLRLNDGTHVLVYRVG